MYVALVLTVKKKIFPTMTKLNFMLNTLLFILLIVSFSSSNEGIEFILKQLVFVRACTNKHLISFIIPSHSFASTRA